MIEKKRPSVDELRRQCAERGIKIERRGLAWSLRLVVSADLIPPKPSTRRQASQPEVMAA